MEFKIKVIDSKKVAFAMMRIQGFHNGHFNLINKMIADNDIVIVGVGSIQISGTFDNPYSFNQKVEIFKLIYGENFNSKGGKLKLIGIEDIGAVTPNQWVDHCFKRIKDKNLPLPTRYYSGSKMDASWFIKSDYEIDVIILDRKIVSICSSGTEIRKGIANGFEEWKNDVPECIHQYLENNFPKKYILNKIINSKLD